MSVPYTFTAGAIIDADQVNDNFNAVVDTNTLASPTGSSGVGFLQSGTGATARTAQAKMRDTVSVKDFGAVGDGVADDTAAIVAACAASNSIEFPTGTYKITASIEPGANKYLHFSNVTILSSVAGPAFLIRGNTDVVTFSGDVLIDCQNTAGSVGLKIQATSAIASPATTNTFDQLFVRRADIGVHLYSDGNQGIYYNDFYRVQVQDSTKGIFLETASGGASQREVNANHFGMVTLQRCVDALTLDGTWGNYFDFVEAETNTGIAINLVDAFSVGINGGWIEGNTTNLFIGNVPNVYGVYIKASIDSALDSADTKFVYTPSDERSIIIENSQYAKWFGRAGFEERVDIGDYGVAANDQGNAPDSLGRLRVTASQDFFRLSAGNPLFFMRARTGTEGWYFGLDNGATRLFDLQRSRAVLDTRLALANSAWDKNQLTLGSYYLWLDATGVLRIKSGAPVNDTDGNAVVYAATLAGTGGAALVGKAGGGTVQDFLTLQPFVYANSSSLYGIIDSTVSGSWVYGSYAGVNTNKLGVNNTKPTDEPSTGARTNDTAYVAGTANVAAIIAGYDNVNNAQAGIIASQHSMIYAGGDHGAIIGGSLHTILDYTDYSGIFAGTSCTIENRGRYSAIIASQASKILTGATDDASGFRGFMASSSSCTIGGRNSAVINGVSVDVLGQYCTVLNGSTVTIGASTTNCLAVGSNLTIGNSAAASQSLIVGTTHTVNGSRNLVVGDNHTVASYSYCTATGTGAIPPFSGSRVHTARNRASVAGNNLSLDFQCSNETTDTTTTRLLVLGSAFPSQPVNSIVTGAFYVSGVSDAGVSSAFRLDFSSVMGASGAPTIKGLTATVLHDDLALPTDPTVVATSTGIYRVQVVGLAATNIRWNARFVGQQMVWG